MLAITNSISATSASRAKPRIARSESRSCERDGFGSSGGGVVSNGQTLVAASRIETTTPLPAARN